MNDISAIAQFYNNSASQYFATTIGCDMSRNLNHVIGKLKPGAFVVDAGCGSGRDTAWLLQKGFRCHSYDASDELRQLAQKLVGSNQPVFCHRHATLAQYLSEPVDAIWASASLLFLNDQDLAEALQAFAECLRPGGILYTTFKHGTGWRQDGVRWFRDLRPEDAGLLESLSGLVLEEVLSDTDTLGRGNQWNAFILRKPQ